MLSISGRNTSLGVGCFSSSNDNSRAYFASIRTALLQDHVMWTIAQKAVTANGRYFNSHSHGDVLFISIPARIHRTSLLTYVERRTSGTAAGCSRAPSPCRCRRGSGRCSSWSARVRRRWWTCRWCWSSSRRQGWRGRGTTVHRGRSLRCDVVWPALPTADVRSTSSFRSPWSWEERPQVLWHKLTRPAVSWHEANALLKLSLLNFNLSEKFLSENTNLGPQIPNFREFGGKIKLLNTHSLVSSVANLQLFVGKLQISMPIF